MTIRVKYLLSCGHASSTLFCSRCGVHQQGQISTSALHGRTAVCWYEEDNADSHQHGGVASDITLPHFRYLREEQRDRYYCGCRGIYPPGDGLPERGTGPVSFSSSRHHH